MCSSDLSNFAFGVGVDLHLHRVHFLVQFGFMPWKGTTDAIFTVWQMQEKYVCKGQKLYFAFVDLEKHMVEYLDGH